MASEHLVIVLKPINEEHEGGVDALVAYLRGKFQNSIIVIYGIVSKSDKVIVDENPSP